jgi:hypothetical protein
VANVQALRSSWGFCVSGWQATVRCGMAPGWAINCPARDRFARPGAGDGAGTAGQHVVIGLQWVSAVGPGLLYPLACH